MIGKFFLLGLLQSTNEHSAREREEERTERIVRAIESSKTGWRQPSPQPAYTKPTESHSNRRREEPPPLLEEDLIQKAIHIVFIQRQASEVILCQQLQIDFELAGHIMNELEDRGIVGPSTDIGQRDILIDLDGGGSTMIL